MQHAVSVSPWGFIQVVIASTIRAKGTDFSSDVKLEILSTHAWCGASSLYEMHVCIIDMAGWQLEAGHHSCQLPLSSAVLGSVPGPGLWRLWTPTSCARTVVTGGRSLPAQRVTSSSSLGNLAGNQRLSVTYVVTTHGQRTWTPASQWTQPPCTPSLTSGRTISTR